MSSKYRRGGLGRGLGALIPTAPPDEAGAGPASDSPAGSPPDPDENSLAPDATGHPGAGGAIKSSEGIAADPVPTEATAADPAGPTAGAAPGPTPVATTGNSVEPAPDSAGDASDLLPVHGARFVEVPVADIRPNPRQPRQVFDEDALAELTHSIREFGVLQPVVVRDISGESGGVPGGYELVMGERRLRAAVAAGLAAVPAIVRTTTDDAMLRDALLENIHRSQLNPLEEAAAYQQLLEEFGATHDELAGRIGRSRPQVSNTIRLLNLPVPVQRRVAAGVLSAGHARALLSVDDTDVQEDLAGRIVAEGLSVRATEELVALHAHGHQTGRTRRKAATPRITAPALAELAERLSDAFDTRVKVELGRSKGKITVEFATIDDLERIVSVMSGHVAADARARAAVAAGEIAAGSDVAAPGPAPVEPEPAEFAEPGEPVEAGTDTPDPSTVPGPDYAGWGSGHVSDPGAWSERPENGG